jgi:hypothetical protein
MQRAAIQEYLTGQRHTVIFEEKHDEIGRLHDLK